MSAPPRVIPFSPVKTPWFIDPAHRNVFSGHRYAFRCVCAVTGPDSTATYITETSNPRKVLGTLQHDHDDKLIVQQAVWSRLRSSEAHLDAVHKILAKAGQSGKDGWFAVPRTHITPLLMQAADSLKLPVLTHAQFAAWVRNLETDKVRADLTLAGLDPVFVAATSVV